MHRRTRLTCHCEERSDVAISGRHLQFVQGVDKTHGPIAPVAAVSDRPVGEHSTAWGLWCTTTLPDVSLRGAKRRGNLGKAVTISPMAFPRCGRVRRDCTPRALPRAARSGRHVGLRPPRNDKSGGIVPLNLCRDHCQPAWRSLSAATDAIGACHFDGGLYGLPVPP